MPTLGQFNTTAVSGSDSHWKVAGGTAPALIMSGSQAENRAWGSIYNDAVGSLYIKFGGGAINDLSVTGTYDVKIASGTLYELKQPTYQGEVWGIWDAAGGWARVCQILGPKN